MGDQATTRASTIILSEEKIVSFRVVYQQTRPTRTRSTSGVGIRTLDNWTAELGFGQNRLGSAFGRTNPPKTVGQARTVGQFRTARLSFGQLGSARTFGQLGQLGQSRAELPNDETHPVPMKMTFDFLFLAKSRFEGVTVSRIALL
jgi:hypothetical protein